MIFSLLIYNYYNYYQAQICLLLIFHTIGFTNGSTQHPPQEASRRKTVIVNPNTYKEQMSQTLEEHPSTNQPNGQAISSAENVQYQQSEISDNFIHSTQAQQLKDLTSYRQTTNPTSSQNSLLQSPVVQKVLYSAVNTTLENIQQRSDPLQSPLTFQSRGSSFQEMSNPYKQPVSEQGHTPFKVASTSTVVPAQLQLTQEKENVQAK